MGTLGPTLGAFELGISIATFLFGIATLQMFLYFRNFPKEKKLVKFIVSDLILIYLCAIVSSLYYIYTVTVTGFGQFALVAETSVSMAGTIACGATIDLLAQLLFILRVQKLSQFPKSAFILPWIAVTAREAISLSIAVLITQVALLHEFIETYSWLLTLALSLGMAIDVGVCMSLCVLLYIKRSQTPIAK
ncbi:hypothetical protein BDP27DRAFT_1231373 [Rhodocollybia butyracea]|uniref:Uncharacterized protein n=1 Tax=Rhodocollybia butyracea TaxID=206335 RepID=A0A9P5U2U4_9AGAR|nr:hypothetical protein BDP27DRAFT_1231373 [Rhodocollybia butyracea]